MQLRAIRSSMVGVLMSLAVHSAVGQCPPEPCTPDFQPTSWTLGVSGGDLNSPHNQNIAMTSGGQLPNALTAQIAFSKAPSPGNGCMFHQGGLPAAPHWNRWAQIPLPSCANYGIRVDYDLNTFDHWVPGSPTNSDVFYLSMGAAPFTAIGSLGAVSCGNAPQFSESIFAGDVYWWGSNALSCSGTCNQTSTIEPCHMQGTRVFDFRLDSADPVLRLGLSTGWCIWSYGTCQIRMLPLTIDIVDPNPEYLTNGVVEEEPDAISISMLLRDGVAADGVTQVVFRHEVLGPGQVHFELQPPEPTFGAPSTVALGSLSSLGGQEQQLAIDVEAVQLFDERWMAFAVYTAPADFFVHSPHDEEACRQVQVTAEYQPDGEVDGMTATTRVFNVVRPPVVLIHGLWSSAGTWDWPIETDQWPIDPNGRFLVEIHNYRNTRAASYATNRSQTRRAVERAVIRMRNFEYAATQADVIGHSMGGVLARLYAAGFQGVPYHRNDNFMAGDIHKLITIASPHKGSPVANLILREGPGLDFFRLAISLSGNCVGCGAVSDLRINSPATVWMNQHTTEVPTHSIVAVGGSYIMENPQVISQILPADQRLLIRLYRFLGIHSQAFPTELHDMFVGETSAGGNVLGSMAATYVPFVNGANPAIHTSMTLEERINDEVIFLLNSSALNLDLFSSGFPIRNLNPTEPPDPPQGALVPGLSMVTPGQGAVYAPGDQITVVLTPINGFVPQSVLVACAVDSALIEAEPWVATLDVPTNAVGPLTLVAAARDSNFDFAQTEEVTVQIVPSADLIDLSIDPESIELTRFGPTASLTVTGHYSDGIDRDLTAAALGTTYASSDTGVATVSIDGLVTSVGFGTCTITASNKSFDAVAQVEVTGMPCPGDIVESETVDIDDLLEIIGSWGPCFACAGDINGSGVVDIDDLLVVIGHWGPCPSPLLGLASFVPEPNYSCIDAIKWEQYLQVLTNGTAAQAQCYNCWAVYRLSDCVGQWDGPPPECGCDNPFE